MTILCSVLGHTAEATHRHNEGLDFTTCHHCGCDLIRAEGKSWSPVPKGFRVVWRAFGRECDALDVVARMQRNLTPPRRRAPRNAPAPALRDRRTRPLSGTASLFGALTNLRDLLSTAAEDVADVSDAPVQKAIRLPNLSGATA
jgi:hypothetical protein